jgi:hypothetical protein
MRGRPSLRVTGMVLALLLMAWPVWRVTRGGEAVAAAPAPASAVVPTAFALHVAFAHPPASFALLSLGQPILEGKNAAEFSGTWRAALPREGADLLLKATWPPGVGRTAVEVRIEAGNETRVARTFWGQGALTEIVTVPVHP